MGAMAWAIKVGRQIIVEIDLDGINPDNIHKLPDHHNKWGEAWWVDEDIPLFIHHRMHNALY